MKGYKELYTAYSAVEAIQQGGVVWITWVDETKNPRVSKVNDMEMEQFAYITLDNGGYELWLKEKQDD